MGIVEMLTTKQILDLIKEKYDLTSDYQLFKFTGWGQSTISGYRLKPQYLSDAHAIQAAKLLDLPAGFVMACIHAERAKVKNIKNEWEHTAALLAPENFKNDYQYILCKIAETPKISPLGQYPLDLQHFPENVTHLYPATFCRSPSKSLFATA